MTEARTVRLVVALLGAVALLLVGGLVGLALLERAIPEGLLTLAGGVIGALSALLVSTRSGTADPTPVQVVQDEPVPVVEAAANPPGARKRMSPTPSSARPLDKEDPL